MAINLLAHFWRGMALGHGLKRGKRTKDWGVELREPSPWNPCSPPAPDAPRSQKEQ